MAKRKTVKKVHVLALGTGYDETSSWAQVILCHDQGFKTIQAALESLHALTLEYCRGEVKSAEESNARRRQWAADRGETIHVDELAPIFKDPAVMIEDVWTEIIHGTLQDHGDMWEMLTGSGWDANAAWVGQKVSKHGICWIENAPQLILESMSWGDQRLMGWDKLPDGKYENPNALYYSAVHMHHTPDGVKRFQSEL